MTYEECVKAMEEGTWLVWCKWEVPILVRVDNLNALVASTDGSQPFANIQTTEGIVLALIEDLRLATPNDMLKYGE